MRLVCRAAVLAARVLVSLVAAVASAPVAEAGRLVSESFASPALGRDWDYDVYLPDGHETGALRYPVLYLLHGSGADRREWVAKGAIDRTADALIAAGEIPPCLIVMPSAGVSWYVDRQERMETALVRDLIPEVERRHRAIPDRFGRAIGGASMGGYGALRFVLRYPELFAAAALMSPSVYVPEPPANSFARWSPPFQTDGRFDPEVWRSLNYPALLDGFLAKGVVVPVHLAAGDQDEFQAEYHAAVLYKVWRDRRWPAELRVAAGAHDYGFWREAAREALRFALRRVRRPEPADAGEAAAGGRP